MEGEQLKEEMEQLRCRNESCRPQQMSGSRSADSESSWLMRRQMQTVAHEETSALLSCTGEKRRGDEKRANSSLPCKQDEESHRKELLEEMEGKTTSLRLLNLLFVISSSLSSPRQPSMLHLHSKESHQI